MSIPAAPDAFASVTGCRAATVATLGQVARRIYLQGAHGRNGASAVARLARSAALSDAVTRGDAAATRAALTPLLKSQILHITVRRGSHVLADIGHVRVIAPVRGRVLDAHGRPVGTYVLSVMNPASYAGITQGVTGAQVLVRPPAQRPGGARGASATTYRTTSFAGQAFPSGPLRISLLIPRAALKGCSAGRANAADVLGAVAERLFYAEAHGTRAAQALAYVTHDQRYRRAVAAGDRAGIDAAVRQGFFHARRYHIVRVRVQRGQHFVVDVGGPFVLAPASTTLRGPGGRVDGRVTLSIQDDTGYIKLLHRFTGGEVVLRERGVPVPGSTLSPAPAHIPRRGTITYRGRRYDAFSFTGRAFPSGPLRISLLVPVG